MKVLCTFGAAYAGGTLRVLTDGLPHLSRQPGIQLAFADLYERDEIQAAFHCEGVAVAKVGVNCPPYVTVRRGLARQVDRVHAIPHHWLIAHRLARAAQNVDVLYAHTRKELTLAAWSCLPPRSGAKIVWHCHGLHGKPPFIAGLAGLCSAVIAISPTTAERLRAIGVPGDRIVTVLNAIDADHVQAGAARPPSIPLPRRDTRQIILVPTAQVCAHKGIHVLLEAARTVPDVQIWITGDMQDPATARYAKDLRALSLSPALIGRVHFLGFRRDIYSVMQAADVVCVPSVCDEAFGLVAAEAMALGKLVIVSNRGALPQIVLHGEGGVVFDPDRPQDLSAAIRTLIDQPAYAERLSAYGPAAVRRRFSYERWAHEVAAVLQDAARR